MTWAELKDRFLEEQALHRQKFGQWSGLRFVRVVRVDPPGNALDDFALDIWTLVSGPTRGATVTVVPSTDVRYAFDADGRTHLHDVLAQGGSTADVQEELAHKLLCGAGLANFREHIGGPYFTIDFTQEPPAKVPAEGPEPS